MSSTLTRRSVLAAAALVPSSLLLPSSSPASAQDATPAPTTSLGWADDLAADDGRLHVATTVAPISSMTRNVGGTLIALRGIVPDGTNSHTFEPAPSDAVVLTMADLVLANGLQLEDPTIELAEANLKPGAEVVTLGDKTIAEGDYVYDFSFPEEDGKPNPHLWMNVAYAKSYTNLVHDALARRDPANAARYAENRDRYLALLTRLDAGIAAVVQTVPEQNRKLLTYHDSYAYFAPRYGMTVIGAVQPSDFSEPSPREVADIIDQIRESGVPAVFGSEVFPSDVLEQIAAEAGAVYIDELRDDEPPGEPNAPEHTYVGMMLNNMRLMIPALGGTVDALAGVEPYDTYLP